MPLPLDLNLIQNLLNGSTVSGNLDDIMTTGFYYVQTPVNSPTSSWPHLFVNANNNKTKVVQLALPDSGNEGMYYRVYYNNSWSEWFKLAAPADVQQVMTLANNANSTSQKALDLVTKLNGEVGEFTSWTNAGITGLNGLGNANNLCWRKATQTSGDRQRVVIEIGGYVTLPNDIQSNKPLEIFQLASNVYNPISTYFAQASTVGNSPASGLEFNSNTGKVSIVNGNSFTIGNFATFISIIIAA